MPTLPPRNLPFSPPGTHSSSSSTPNAPSTSAIAKRTASASSNAATTPSKSRSSDGSGVLPRQEETTYHRKLRNILLDHSSATEKWDDVVGSQGAKTIAALASLSASLDDVLSKQSEKGEVSKVDFLRLNTLEVEARRMDEMAMLLKGLEAEKDNLNEDMLKVNKAVNKLESLSEAAEILLVEATRAKGSEFTFEAGMWVTWSMDRLGEIDERLQGHSHPTKLMLLPIPISQHFAASYLSICVADRASSLLE
jgi:hypothetical protein